MLNSRTKHIAYTACFVAALAIAGLSISIRGKQNGYIASKNHTPAKKESDAARFARGLEVKSNKGVIGKQQPTQTVDNAAHKPTTLTSSQKEPERHLEDAAVQAESGSETIARELKKKRKANPIEGRNEGETIAKTLARMKMKLRHPVNKQTMKMRSHSLNTEENTDNVFPYRYPKIRYVQWNELSAETKEIVEEAFGYDEGSWNDISHDIESEQFSKLSDDHQKSALLLGIDENVWDCFINRKCHTFRITIYILCSSHLPEYIY